VNTKKIVTRLLLIFVLLSTTFLIYKEFVQGGHEKENQSAEIKAKNTVSQGPPVSKTSQEIVSKPENKAAPLNAALKPAKSKVIAYYFHGTFRCSTCRTIEKYSHDAIQEYFSKELGNGKLEFKPLNVEDPENRHYIQDYQLFSKSLVLSLVADGKEIKWKNLTDVWSYVSDKEKFYQYVKDEIDNFLKEI
jgi:hypothetical protein